MAGKLLKAAFGPLSLYVLETRTQIGRTQATHAPATGDGFVHQDRGPVLERVTCTLCFCEIVDETEDHFVRYERFRALVRAGTPQIFTHPLHGSYLARIGAGELGNPPDANDWTVTIEFLQETPVVAVRSIGGILLGPLSGLLGPDAVNAQLEDMRDLLEDFPDVQTSAPAAAAAAVSGWTSGDAVNPRQVDAELASSVQGLDGELRDLGLAGALDRWELYKAYILLRASVVDAAAAATANADQSFDYELASPTPVRALLARIYGASNAEARLDAFQQLNPGVRSPLLPSGTYRLPAPGSR